jgi:predicted ATPase/DNA-binding SARP family transcriptional activator/Tfp pilus assembly protein PilF
VTKEASPSLVLLGSPHLRHGDARIDLPDALPGYLVAYLATRGDWVLREEIAVLLWPEAAESEAQNNLRVNLTRLRPHLSRWGIEPMFVAERRRLRLDLASDVRAMRAAHARGAWVDTAEAARGQFLEGVSFRAFAVLGEWARSEREALRALWRDAVLRAGDAIAPQSRLDLAARYLAADPFDEDIVRVQLGALAALGRSDEAQRVFERFDANSRAELGVGATRALADYAERLGSPAAGDARPAARIVAADPLIGREADLAALTQSLVDARLVVVIGLGGIGKTRVAREVVAGLASRFADGTVWLPLADLSDISGLVNRLLGQLGLVAPLPAPPLDRLIEHLADKRMLLAFDNAEHLLPHRNQLTALITQVLATCAGVRFLVTSREPLHHPHERLFRLGGLATPAGGGGSEALSSPAVQLFVQRAGRVRPDFDPRGATRELTQIAALCGGMPLALRIAASWMSFLSCADVAAEIRRGLDALEPGADDGAGVHSVIARAVGGLADEHRDALLRLSVFVGPFTPRAAQEVAQARLGSVGALVERCLLSPSTHTGTEAGDDPALLDLHPLVRTYAAAELAKDHAREHAAREQHASHIARKVQRWADFPRVDQTKASAVIAGCLPDLLAAWRWSLDVARMDLVVLFARALRGYYDRSARWSEAVPLFADAERRLDPDRSQELPALVEIGRASTTMLANIGDFGLAEQTARRTLAWARSVGNDVVTFGALNGLGGLLSHVGRYRDAYEPLEEALEIARRLGERVFEAMIAHNLALARQHAGDYEQAETLLRESLTLRRSFGEGRGTVVSLNNLGNLLRHLGRFDEARAAIDEGLRLCDVQGRMATRTHLLVSLARLHRAEGRLDAAITVIEAALEAAQSGGEYMAETTAMLLRADYALQQRDALTAKRFLHRAFLRTRAGDTPNALQAVARFADWCAAVGREQDAMVAWLVVLGHPCVYAMLRSDVQERWQTLNPAPGLIAAAEPKARQTDLLTMTERALAELTQATAHG